MPPLTRGPLPAGVYWRRRIFVLLLAATMVFVVASVLSGGSDGEDDEAPAAQQAAGEVEPSETITVKDRRKGRKGKRNSVVVGPTYDPTVMVDPEGNCEPADIKITPRIETAIAGEPVTIGLTLQTVQADACYFRIGADKVTLNITKRGREVWTSRECPDPVPAESVVVRRVVATVVEMTWTPYPQGRRGAECPGTDEWLLPGDFTATAAALGGEPADSDFDAPLAHARDGHGARGPAGQAGPQGRSGPRRPRGRDGAGGGPGRPARAAGLRPVHRRASPVAAALSPPVVEQPERPRLPRSSSSRRAPPRSSSSPSALARGRIETR